MRNPVIGIPQYIKEVTILENKNLLDILRNYPPSEVFQALLDYLDVCRVEVRQAQDIVTQEDAKTPGFPTCNRI